MSDRAVSTDPNRPHRLVLVEAATAVPMYAPSKLVSLGPLMVVRAPVGPPATVPDEHAICREVARVVRPGGDVRLIEHVRSEQRVAGALMRAVDPVWCWINGQGCHLDRDPLPALERAGLRIEAIDAFQIWSAGIPAFPMRAIHARRSG